MKITMEKTHQPNGSEDVWVTFLAIRQSKGQERDGIKQGPHVSNDKKGPLVLFNAYKSYSGWNTGPSYVEIISETMK